MEVLFKNRKLQKLCCSEKECLRKWGTENGRKIMQRLNEIRAADTLGIYLNLRSGDPHALTGDRKGRFAVRVKQPYRLVFEPANDPLPAKEDGSMDLDRVTEVRIVEIVDYHG
jgi:plasmid maintenance system killer protein